MIRGKATVKTNALKTDRYDSFSALSQSFGESTK